MLLPLVRAMRPHQWVKNLFVLAPVVFAHSLADLDVVSRAAAAFVVFCAASSAVYLVNDLRDREEDRLHPLKRDRPIASGELSIRAAGVAAAVLGLGAAAGAFALGTLVLAILGLYLGINLLYSWGLKNVVIIDVMAVAIGFVLRVEAGAAAIGVAVSSWLALCTIFVALFLTFSKRRHELELLAEDASNQRSVLSHYSQVFLDQMINVVTASTVVSYALYAMTDETVAKHGRGLVYTVPLVLFGIFRYLYLVYQRRDLRNPTEALLRDPPFVVNILLWGIAVLWILYGP